VRIHSVPPLGPRSTLRAQEPGWPARLCDLADPPVELELAGQLPALSPVVAIVGTRRPDRRGAAFARRLSRELAEAGCLIVSGGALGIDSEAHRGALEAGAPTVAILPSSLDDPYPLKNRQLFTEIASAGGLLSELPLGTPIFRSRFLHRNRLVAALADVVVVVQAPARSGALSTAAAARRLGRPVLGVPHAPGDPLGEGCLALLARGAGICRGSADVLSLAAAGSGQSRFKKRSTNLRRPGKDKEFQGLDSDERAVVRALKGDVATVDELCEASALPAARVQRALLMLLLSKVIHEVGSGCYALSDYR
jgi:DNA processing protein